ncbi:MAG: glycosyltransferase family 2 protein [Gemmatimonadetes bacterium]|jgi:glycosyltransferase involved in cell wall biosynthesis|nr:glycosyltransferase family 2 protein [Gemmatimonadota bacterium]MBT5058639.1 glycosyltransferase family 2 protein [Gemmatimonadota bacterium]MBT5144076.1 glycosyltransferase family 2 protein [Gemmatimonadota bacterium]MBT5590319.1 glycosyltransferase family 2 protein [Gemmatimonadota bacterium]MBT5964384.1 glycosyltransferase family 2 protein [Gemmatimonadota bacterium]
MSEDAAEHTNPVRLSIVIPVFNEEESLPPLCAKLDTVLTDLGLSHEVIFIDDGSTDASYEELTKLGAQYSWLRAVQFRRNYRKAAALAAGFKQAQGEFIVTMDADLQDDPEEIRGLLQQLEEEGLDLVSGWKKKRHDPISKTLPSKVFNLVTSIVSGIRLHDFNCGLKIYRHEVTEDALPYLYGELYRFLPAIAHWAGYRVGERAVTHHARKYGVSKFGAKRLLNGFLDLLSITFVVRFMTTPMHIFGTLGLLSTMAGGGIGAYISWLWWQSGTIQNRHPLMMLGVLLIIVGIQFFSTGLLGDMLASMHQRGGRTPRITSRLR